MHKSYITIHGETRPYKVLMVSSNPKNAKDIKHVAVMRSHNNDGVDRDVLVTTFTASKVFIGKSPKCELTTTGGIHHTHGSAYDGNTLLLHLKHDMYIFIGKEIIKFRSFSNIKAFVSPLNSDGVPFPYAVDSKNNTYLFKEGVVLMNLSSNDYKNPYDYYEDYRVVVSDKKSKKPKHQISMSLNDDEEQQKVLEIYVGDEQQCLKYESDSVEQFNRMTDNGTKKMYIIFADDPSRMISIDDEDLKKLMISFGTKAQFRPLRKSSIIKNPVEVSEES